MNLRAALKLFLLVTVCLWLRVSGMPLDAAQPMQRTSLPLLLLLSLPQANIGGGLLPGIPIRRPQDEQPTQLTSMSAMSSMSSMSQLADELPQSAAGSDAVIREQFIQGILQGLQSQAASGGPTVQPAVLADFLQQLNAVRTTETPKIYPPTVDKETQANESNDADYDYIDFKNGSRIKYDLDNDQQSADDVKYPNKILGEAQLVGYYKSQQHVI